jgi:hypothetical protein
MPDDADEDPEVNVEFDEDESDEDELLLDAGAESCDYYPPPHLPGMSSYCRTYYTDKPEEVHAAVTAALRKDLKDFGCSG